MWTWKNTRLTFFFLFNFTRRRSLILLFWFFFRCKMRYFQLSGLCYTYLTYQIRHTATYIYVEIHKMLNFSSICSGDWNINLLNLSWIMSIFEESGAFNFTVLYFRLCTTAISIWPASSATPGSLPTTSSRAISSGFLCSPNCRVQSKCRSNSLWKSTGKYHMSCYVRECTFWRAPIEDSEQPEHQHSLIRVFIVSIRNFTSFSIQNA